MTTSAKAKDFFKKDLNVFLNPNEFGEPHKVNGEEVVVVLDNEALKERRVKSAEGTYKGDVLFYVKKSDLKTTPKVGRTIDFDDETYIVADVVIDGDMYAITLEANMA